MIKDLAAPMGHRQASDNRESAPRVSLPSIMAGRRVGTMLLYTMGTLFLAVFCSIVFNTLELQAEFAMAVMGSLIGGFLGALLAAALIVDMYLPKRRREFRDQD